MYSIQDIIASFEHDTRIINHLVSKIPADQYDWKPAEGSRTFRELLTYMARMGTAPLHIALHGYDPEAMKELRLAGEARDVTTDFAAMMDEQLATIKTTLLGLSPETFDEEVEIFGNKQLRKQFILEIALKNYPAYRMQLFTYLKTGLGMSELNTANLRQGVDMPA